MNLSVIIPTYKNTDMLVRNLRINLPFLEGNEIIVVNDFPEESLVEIMQEFPNVILLENAVNLGFGSTVNRGVEAASDELVMLLNNDVVLTDRSYEKAFAQFESNNKLFGVSFAQKEKDGNIVGKNRIYWQDGFFQHSKATDLTAGINAWAEGGSSIINRAKYLELKGFDPIYLPFYWEDVDLSYRAWKSGYEVRFEPEIVVEHHHESTIGKYFQNDTIQTTAFRNQLLFIWKNINDQHLRGEHFSALFSLLLKKMIKWQGSDIKAFFQALKRLRGVSDAQKISYAKTDREVLQLFQ